MFKTEVGTGQMVGRWVYLRVEFENGETRSHLHLLLRNPGDQVDVSSAKRNGRVGRFGLTICVLIALVPGLDTQA
jgi:hypothetical protein